MSMSQSYAPQAPGGYQVNQQQPKLPSAIVSEVSLAQQIEGRLARLVHRLHGSPPQAVRQSWDQQQDGAQNIERCISQLNQSHGSSNRLLDEVEQLI